LPIWIRIKLRRPGASREIEVSAKVNTGFTIGPQPILRLPRAVAEELGFDVGEAEPMPGIYDTALRPLPTRSQSILEGTWTEKYLPALGLYL